MTTDLVGEKYTLHYIANTRPFLLKLYTKKRKEQIKCLINFKHSVCSNVLNLYL